MHRWGLAQFPECPRCHGEEQTVDHLVLRCPETAIEGGFEAVLQCECYKELAERGCGGVKTKRNYYYNY